MIPAKIEIGKAGSALRNKAKSINVNAKPLKLYKNNFIKKIIINYTI